MTHGVTSLTREPPTAPSGRFVRRVRGDGHSARCTWLLAVLTVSSASACGNADGPLPDVGAGGGAAPIHETPDSVHVRFDPEDATPSTLGDIPWPDDLYLDKAGRVDIDAFDDVELDSDRSRLLRDSLAQLDGFGVSSPIFFYLDGLIDPATLPQAEVDSLDAQASVFLVDADTGSPEAFSKVPVGVQWQRDRKRLALRPADGHPLTPGRRYAAVLTRRIKDRKGRELEPSPNFAAIRDPALALTDARLLAARSVYTPVLETLVKSGGVKRQDISGMSVFHVQSVEQDLVDARRQVRLGGPPELALARSISGSELDRALGAHPPSQVGLDEAGGVQHDQLAAMVHGTLPSPNLLSATVNAHGAFERGETGTLRVKRIDAVPFTLFIPVIAARAPIVIYQHQRDRERSDALAIANELARRGIAVLALDAPFQGLRAPQQAGSVDWRNRFTGEEAPDGFGDAPGDFLGRGAAGVDDTAWNPVFARDAMRQGVVDLMVAVRVIEEGQLDGTHPGRTFVRTHVGFVGEDTGAEMGAMLARVEPKLQALALVAPGADSLVQWSWSPHDASLFESFARGFGRDPETIEPRFDPPEYWPETALYQTLLDRGEALSHVAALRRTPTNVLVLMAAHDETVPNRATEAFAAALGLTLVNDTPRYVLDLRSEEGAPSGIGGNYPAAGGWVTRAMYVLRPASHDFLRHRLGIQQFAEPPEPPFEELAQGVRVENPTAAAIAQIASYFESFYACATSDSTPPNIPCSAYTSSE
jgi:hypothetical protein